MTATAFIDDPESYRLLDLIFDRIDFEHFVFDYKGRPTFRMAYNPIKGGDYLDATGNPWIYHWHMTAEKL